MEVLVYGSARVCTPREGIPDTKKYGCFEKCKLKVHI